MQHRRILLQLRQGPGRFFRAESGRHRNPHRPLQERSLELRFPRTTEPLGERFRRPLQIRRRTAVLEAQQCRDQVVPRKIVVPAARCVKQEVALRGLIVRERLDRRHGQPRHVAGRRPARTSVVEHDREHRGQLAARTERSAADEVLVQQPRIDQHADRHVPVDRGLELEQYQHVQPPGVAEAHPPPWRLRRSSLTNSAGSFSSVAKSSASLHVAAAKPRSRSSTIRGWENSFLYAASCTPPL